MSAQSSPQSEDRPPDFRLQRSSVFAGRTAVVTGAGGDIGRAASQRLAAGGARLVLTDLEVAADGLTTTAELCRQHGVDEEPTITYCDVTNEADVEATFADLQKVGIVADLLFNNAGYQGHFTNTADYDIDDFRRVMDINVSGIFIVLRNFARRLIGTGQPGVIVNTASMAHGGAPNMVAYSASKAAVVALTKSAAKDLAPSNIRVNCISPAFIGPGAMWDRQVELQANTPSQYFSDDPEEVEKQMIGAVPMRRYGSLDEVAASVQFLLSEESSYITAFNIEISGGAT